MIRPEMILAAGVGAGVVSIALVFNGAIVPAILPFIGAIAAICVYSNSPLSAPRLYHQVFEEAESRGMTAAQADAIAQAAELNFGSDPCRTQRMLEYVFNDVFGDYMDERN